MTFTASGPGHIYCKYTKATKDDDLLETMNENNWHEFLNGSILSTLEGIRRKENQWLKNITANLEWCIYHYKYAFDKIAHLYHKLLERGPIETFFVILTSHQKYERDHGKARLHKTLLQMCR